MDDYDFDPAAFGLPTSFGGSSSGGGGGSKKAISSSTNSNSSSNPAKASLDKTRRKEAAATKAEEARSSVSLCESICDAIPVPAYAVLRSCNDEEQLNDLYLHRCSLGYHPAPRE